MSPTIKIGSSKTAAKKTTVKPTTRKTATKPAAKTAATKAGAKAAPKAAPKKTTATRKPAAPKIDPKIVAQHEKKLKSAGDKRVKKLAEYEESVDDMALVVAEAMAAGVSMSVIHGATGVSRQWLYKINQHRGRNGTAKKPAAKKAVAAAAKKVNTGTKKPVARKPAAKTPAATRVKRSGTSIKIK